MNTIFRNSESSKTSDPHRLLLNLKDKTDLMKKYIIYCFIKFSIYYTWKNIKKSYKNNKFKTSAPIWKKEFELTNDSYAISSIQDYLECIFKKHGEKTVNPSKRIYTNKIENRPRLKSKQDVILKF